VAQRRFQRLIDEKDYALKVARIDSTDWSNNECPSDMIKRGIAAAFQHRISAVISSSTTDDGVVASDPH
jgi:hypothetical protein